MCHRLRSAEVLLGIISFSPAKGRGEATRLLMAVVFQRGCFPGGCAVFPQAVSPWKPNPSHSGCGQQGLRSGCGCEALDVLLPCPGRVGPSLSFSAFWDTPRHSPVTHGAPWAPYGWPVEHPAAPRSLCSRASVCREKATLTVRCFLHKREPGAQSCPRISSVLCTIKWGQKSHGNCLFCKNHNAPGGWPVCSDLSKK